MEPKKSSLKVVVVVLLLVAGAGFVGWRLGHSNKAATTGSTVSESAAPGVSYTLPDGWKAGSCAQSDDRIFITPVGTTLNCSADPSAPIKIATDPQNTTDCNQLQSIPNVRKHICISLYIDGHKSLKSLTEYPSSSTYAQGRTFSDYFISTNSGVVKIEYTYVGNNDYQTGFDQLATGVKVK